MDNAVPTVQVCIPYMWECTRLEAVSDKVDQLLVHGRRFPSDTQTSSTTKTGRHDIAEILLKVVLNTINQIKSNHLICGMINYYLPFL